MAENRVLKKLSPFYANLSMISAKKHKSYPHALKFGREKLSPQFVK